MMSDHLNKMGCVFHCAQALFLVGLIPSLANAGSITGNIGSAYMDPCAAPAGGAGTCSAALSSQYLERCLANFEGLTPTNQWNPDACNSGHCQGWKLTTRSKVLVTDFRTTQFPAAYQAQYCTGKRLHIIGELQSGVAQLPYKHLCQSATGEVSTYNTLTGGATIVKSIIMKPGNINAIQLPPYVTTSGGLTYSSKVDYRRVYVRAADPDGALVVPGRRDKNNYLYSLSLKDAICTWRKFCNPTTSGLKAGVSTAGEALLPGATSFEPNHPIARLCQLDPKWHMSNAAVSCAITQAGGIDALCATPDPLHKNPTVGQP